MVSFESRYASDFYRRAEPEREAQKYVRRDFAMPRHYPESNDLTIASTVSALLQRVSGTSIEDIEILIVELQTLRLRLTTEVARIEHEIVEYATLNQAAIESTKIIAENISSLKNDHRTGCHFLPS